MYYFQDFNDFIKEIKREQKDQISIFSILDQNKNFIKDVILENYPDVIKKYTDEQKINANDIESVFVCDSAFNINPLIDTLGNYRFPIIVVPYWYSLKKKRSIDINDIKVFTFDIRLDYFRMSNGMLETFKALSLFKEIDFLYEFKDRADVLLMDRSIIPIFITTNIVYHKALKSPDYKVNKFILENYNSFFEKFFELINTKKLIGILKRSTRDDFKNLIWDKYLFFSSVLNEDQFRRINNLNDYKLLNFILDQDEYAITNINLKLDEIRFLQKDQNIFKKVLDVLKNVKIVYIKGLNNYIHKFEIYGGDSEVDKYIWFLYSLTFINDKSILDTVDKIAKDHLKSITNIIKDTDLFSIGYREE